jgi:hypothetical protein
MVEHVSNDRGDELGRKKLAYAKWGCRYYVVYDPELQISRKTLHVFELVNRRYVAMSAPYYFPSLGVGVKLWTGARATHTFLRLCDRFGGVLLTGDERAEEERFRAEQERFRADRAEALAERERRSAERERVRAERERVRAERAEERVAAAEHIAETVRVEMEALREKLRKLGLEGNDSR